MGPAGRSYRSSGLSPRPSPDQPGYWPPSRQLADHTVTGNGTGTGTEREWNGNGTGTERERNGNGTGTERERNGTERDMTTWNGRNGTEMERNANRNEMDRSSDRTGMKTEQTGRRERNETERYEDVMKDTDQPAARARPQLISPLSRSDAASSICIRFLNIVPAIYKRYLSYHTCLGHLNSRVWLARAAQPRAPANRAMGCRRKSG